MNKFSERNYLASLPLFLLSTLKMLRVNKRTKKAKDPVECTSAHKSKYIKVTTQCEHICIYTYFIYNKYINIKKKYTYTYVHSYMYYKYGHTYIYIHFFFCFSACHLPFIINIEIQNRNCCCFFLLFHCFILLHLNILVQFSTHHIIYY